MPQDTGGLLPFPTIHLALFTSPGKGHHDADALSCIKWPEAMELDSQAVHTVCEGVQAPHSKIETLCYGAQVMDVLVPR